MMYYYIFWSSRELSDGRLEGPYTEDEAVKNYNLKMRQFRDDNSFIMTVLCGKIVDMVPIPSVVEYRIKK